MGGGTCAFLGERARLLPGKGGSDACRGASGKDFLAERAPLSFPRKPEGGRNLNPQSEGGLPPLEADQQTAPACEEKKKHTGDDGTPPSTNTIGGIGENGTVGLGY